MADEAYWEADGLSIDAHAALGNAQKAYRDMYNRDPHSGRGTVSALYASSETPDDAASTYDGAQTTTVSSLLMAAPPAEGATVLGETRTVAKSTKAVTTSETSQTIEDAPEADQATETPAAGDDNATEKEKEETQTKADITDGNTAKANTPVVMAKHFAWGWLSLIVAAGAGVAVEEYVRRRTAKAKASDTKDTTD
jgi:hypothetical protein